MNYALRPSSNVQNYTILRRGNPFRDWSYILCRRSKALHGCLALCSIILILLRSELEFRLKTYVLFGFTLNLKKISNNLWEVNNYSIWTNKFNKIFWKLKKQKSRIFSFFLNIQIIDHRKKFPLFLRYIYCLSCCNIFIALRYAL